MTYSRAAVRHGRVHEQHHRRDQEPDGLHGRLPAHDRQGHLRHQRHRACRGLPAGPLARASTSSAPPTRPPTRTSSAARSSRAAAPGSSSRSTSATWSASASTASASSPSPSCSRRSAGTTPSILEQFGEYESMRTTLEKDHIAGQDEALLDIYRKLRPGEPPTREAAQTLLDNLYFNPKRYDLAKVGRYKINKKLGLEPADQRGHADRGRHRRDDRVPRDAARRRPTWRSASTSNDDASFEVDDIDHFGNRRLRTVGELIQNQVRTGPGPHGARRPRADDHPGRRGDHAADPDQHPPGRRLASRSSSAPPSCRSSWTRPTRWPA